MLSVWQTHMVLFYRVLQGGLKSVDVLLQVYPETDNQAERLDYCEGDWLAGSCTTLHRCCCTCTVAACAAPALAAQCSCGCGG